MHFNSVSLRFARQAWPVVLGLALWNCACSTGLALIVALALPAVAGLAQGGCTVQSTPYFTEYYGDVSVDSAPAPIGAVVEAVNGQGVQAGCFVVTIPGIYGYMRVYGADPATGTPGMANNEAVTFKVNAAAATSVPTSVLWSSGGGPHKVDLASQNLPTAVPDLRASKSETGITLTWSDVGGNVDHYEVWRSSAPYFTPGAGGSTKIAPHVAPNPGGSVSFTDTTGHVGNPDVNDYYVVLAVSSGGAKSPASNRVGGFDFALTPGSS